MKAIKLLAFVLSFSLASAYAQSLYAPSVNNGGTVDVVLLNNSGHTLIYQNSSSSEHSQCAVISGSTTVPSGSYMIIRGTYDISQGGAGLSCQIAFTEADVENNDLYLEVFDPTYIYQGAQEFRFYDGGTPISSDYTPSAYPENDPKVLMDQNVTLILNPF